MHIIYLAKHKLRDSYGDRIYLFTLKNKMIETTKYLETGPSREFEKSLPGVQNHLERSVPGVRTPIRAIPPGSSRLARTIPPGSSWLRSESCTRDIWVQSYVYIYIYICVHTRESQEFVPPLYLVCRITERSLPGVRGARERSLPGVREQFRTIRPGSSKTTRTIHAGSCNYPSRERLLSL